MFPNTIEQDAAVSQELNAKLNIVQRAAMTVTADTHPDVCGPLGFSSEESANQDSRHCLYEIRRIPKDHVLWVTKVVTIGQETAPWPKSPKAYTAPSYLATTGIESFTYPVDVDAEMQSANLAKERSLKDLLPEFYEDIGKLFR